MMTPICQLVDAPKKKAEQEPDEECNTESVQKPLHRGGYDDLVNCIRLVRIGERLGLLPVRLRGGAITGMVWLGAQWAPIVVGGSHGPLREK